MRSCAVGFVYAGLCITGQFDVSQYSACVHKVHQTSTKRHTTQFANAAKGKITTAFSTSSNVSCPHSLPNTSAPPLLPPKRRTLGFNVQYELIVGRQRDSLSPEDEKRAFMQITPSEAGWDAFKLAHFPFWHGSSSSFGLCTGMTGCMVSYSWLSSKSF